MRVRRNTDTTARAPRTSSWTAGSWLAHQVGFWLLVVVAVAAVFGFALHFAPRSAEATGPVEPAGPAGLSIDEQTAGALAVGFVGSWLDATRERPEALGEYVSIDQLALPEMPTEYRDLRLVSVETKKDAAVVSVKVAASISEPQPAEEGKEPTAAWIPRYFQVLVHVEQGSAGVVGLPAPVASPATPEDDLSLEYSDALTTSEGAGAAAQAFLEAYLTGAGDVTRLVSPDAEIAAVLPRVFTEISIDQVNGNTEASATPSDGDEVRMIIRSAGTTAAGAELTSTYLLTATARAGRWEISTVDTFPAMSN